MTTHRFFPLALIALAVLAGCSTVPADNARLDEARREYRIAQDNPQARALAGPELKQAGDALARADQAWTRRDSLAEVDHWAYLARQRVAIAQETARLKTAELAVTNADAARNQVRLAARTNEADAAQRSAESAQRNAEASQRQSEASKRQSDASRLEAEAAQRQASEAQERTRQLEMQLKDLNAKTTDRGLVITIGDVLFETDKAELRSGGLRNVEKLAGFLNQYPQRKARIEGFTDSIGTDSHNQALSGRRADAVRTAMLGLGIGSERVAAQGYGESYPVAGNDSAGGRQLNRRVEIILSDESGRIAPR